MDPSVVLATFDAQLRRHPPVRAPDQRTERDVTVVRVLGGADGWSGVTWSRLDEARVDAVIAAQVDRFAELGTGEWEWKHYAYDAPANLPERLVAAGFRPEPSETVMVAELAGLVLDHPPPPGVELRPVGDARGIDALVRVHDEVFGEDHSALGRMLREAVASDPPSVAAVVAMAGGEAVAAGRVEFHTGTEFASLWGGGTLPAWRRRGIFRALVARRAALAAARGFRYLHVDASPESRPILERLGFAVLATTTPFIHPGRPR